MTAESYAAAVIEVLRPHFPDVLTWWIEQSAADRDPAGEFIMDDPMRSTWRLKPDSADRSRVRLVYYPMFPPGSDEPAVTAGREEDR